MGRYYLDTSALVKSYHPEPGTADVQRLLRDPGSVFLISRLATVEMVSGFAGKVRAGHISAGDFDKLRRRFYADLRRRMVCPIRIRNIHYQIAGELIARHAMTQPLRTLDAIQLAVALHVHRSAPLDHFVCADQRLCDVATWEGLIVIKPGP